MGTVVQTGYDPTVAAATHAALPFVHQRGDNPIVFSREALVQFALGNLVAGEQAAIAGKLRDAQIPVPGSTAPFELCKADKQIMSEAGKTIDKLNQPETATQTDVPARDAAIIYYLANRRAARLAFKGARSMPGAAIAIPHTSAGMPGGGSGEGPAAPTINVPGIGPVSVPVPSFPTIPSFPSGGGPPVIPGPIFMTKQLAFTPLGALVTVVIALSAIGAAAWVADDVMTKAQSTGLAADLAESANKAKVATDLGMATIAAGGEVDIPSLIANMAKKEYRDATFTPWIIGGVVVAGVVAVGVAYVSGRASGARSAMMARVW